MNVLDKRFATLAAFKAGGLIASVVHARFLAQATPLLCGSSGMKRIGLFVTTQPVQWVDTTTRNKGGHITTLKINHLNSSRFLYQLYI